MLEQLGTFVNSDTSGKPGNDSGAQSVGGNAGGDGPTQAGATLHGYDVEGPDTERIGTEPRRLNRDGSVDRRTLRGKRGKSTTTDGEKESVHLSRISLTDLLFSIHLMGAEFLSTPELELDRDEAKKLGDAITEVGKYYNVSFDPKKVAIFQLAITAGGIYGVRFVAIRNRLKQSQEKIGGPQPVPPKAASPEPQKPAPRANGLASPSAIFGMEDGAL